MSPAPYWSVSFSRPERFETHDATENTKAIRRTMDAARRRRFLRQIPGFAGAGKREPDSSTGCPLARQESQVWCSLSTREHMSLISRAKISKEGCKKNVKIVLASRFVSVVGFAAVKWYDLSQKIGLGPLRCIPAAEGFRTVYAAILAFAFCGTADS